MKKLILTVTVVAGAAMAAYSQGAVDFTDTTTSGYVVADPAGHLSSSTASYAASSDFTAQLWALPGNVTTTSGLGIDAYGYISAASFLGDGFNLVSTTLGGSGNGVSAGDGYFDDGGVAISGTTGNDSGAVKDVLAVVCWTGHAQSTLAAALSAGQLVGILAFVNPIGAGGTDPIVPGLSGWNNGLGASPASVANEPPGYPELIMGTVPEPTTFALMGLGGLSLLLFRRRS